MKRLAGLVIVGIVLGVWFGLDKKERDSKRPEVPAPEQHEAPAPPSERDPLFGDPVDSKTADAQRAAMHFVYDACSKYYVFREGSRLSSNYVGDFVDRGARHPIVNVRVDVFDDRKVNGDVLWYRVDLDSKNHPAKIWATKRSAAEACQVEKE